MVHGTRLACASDQNLASSGQPGDHTRTGLWKTTSQPYLTPCPTCLHTKVLPSGLGLSPASSLLKALTHAVPSAWKAPPCTLHMAGSSHASGLGLNATSPESSPCAQTKDWSLIFMHSFCCD